jgi:hypothetical protein
MNDERQVLAVQTLADGSSTFGGWAEIPTAYLFHFSQILAVQPLADGRKYQLRTSFTFLYSRFLLCSHKETLQY